MIHEGKVLSNLKKREEFKSIMDKGKLGHKWTHERVDKASEEVTISVNWMKKQKKLEKPYVNMSLIYTLLEFPHGLKSRMLKNYGKTFRMTQSLKIKWQI